MTSVTGALIVTGRPPGSYTYDPPQEITTTAAGGRQRVLRLESTLWDTVTFVNARKPYILEAANAECDVIELQGVVFDPRFWAGDVVQPAGLPDLRLLSTRWSIDGGKPTMSLSGQVLA